MTIKTFYLCNKKLLLNKNYFIKWIDEIKDEVIVFLDKSKNIKIFSSICAHFGGEIHFDTSKNELRCKWHNWKFCTKTGKCLTHPIKGKFTNTDVWATNLLPSIISI